MFIPTKRLLLRPGWIDDAPELTNALADEAIARNLCRLPWPYTQGDALNFLSSTHGKLAPEFLIYARTDAAPLLVGGIGLVFDDTHDDMPELGYWIAKDHWGKGYATEAGHAVINHALYSLKIAGIRAGHFLDNPGSGRVLKKLGFIPTGEVVSRHSLGRGVDVPCKLMKLRFDAVEDAMLDAA
jgi:RimJ/RimL family protein N-acetyltransferase